MLFFLRKDVIGESASLEVLNRNSGFLSNFAFGTCFWSFIQF
jgi:hypothetical protein